MTSKHQCKVPRIVQVITVVRGLVTGVLVDAQGVGRVDFLPWLARHFLPHQIYFNYVHEVGTHK
jgi:hypothetical protein